MKRIATASLLALAVVVSHTTSVQAWCRRSTPVWSDATPVRIVIHPDMHNFIRHPYVDAGGVPQEFRVSAWFGGCERMSQA